MQTSQGNIVIFVITITIILLLLAIFIVSMMLAYQKKRIEYEKELENMRSEYEKNLLATQLEIQEQTFQGISREIHDHICLNLTLAKLNLVTLDPENKQLVSERINSSVDILGNSIHELSDISHSMNSELIESQGLIKALELEIEKIIRPGMFKVNFDITGNPIFMEASKELVVFRIVQEAFNNIIKHAKAKMVLLRLYYNEDHMEATIFDDGTGFNINDLYKGENRKQKSGLTNMSKRTKLISGEYTLQSEPGKGTTIHLSIPY